MESCKKCGDKMVCSSCLQRPINCTCAPEKCAVCEGSGTLHPDKGGDHKWRCRVCGGTGHKETE